MPRVGFRVEHNWQELLVIVEDGIATISVGGMYTCPYREAARVGDAGIAQRSDAPLQIPMTAEGITVDWNLWRCRGTYRYARIVVTTEGYTVFWRNHDGTYSQVFATTFADAKSYHIRVTNHTKTRFVR